MKKLYLFLAILLAILAGFHSTSAINPGVIASINTNSLTKLIRQLTPDIFESLRELPIPNQNGRFLGIKWWLENIRISTLDLHKTDVDARNGIYINFSQIDLKLDAHLRYKPWFFRTRNCSASATVKGGAIKYRVYLHPGSDSKLKVDLTQMYFEFPRASVRFNGGLLSKIIQFVINLLSGLFSGAINSMRGKINEKLATSFAGVFKNTTLRIPISNWGVMNFGLTKSVQYVNNNIIASFNGETTAIQHKTPQHTRHQMSLPPHANLLQFKFSPFFFNTFFESYYAARSADYTRYVRQVRKSLFKKIIFPYPLALQANDQDLHKWDAISPAIASKYTGKTLKIPMTLAEAPRITFTPGTIQLQVDPLISFTLEDGTELFSVRGRTNIATTATIAQNTQGYTILLLQFNKLDIKFETVASAIGPINFDTVNEMTKYFNSYFVLPIVNALIGEGFPLPSSPALHLVNSQFKVESNALYLTTDIRYVKSRSRLLPRLGDGFNPRSPVFGEDFDTNDGDETLADVMAGNDELLDDDQYDFNEGDDEYLYNGDGDDYVDEEDDYEDIADQDDEYAYDQGDDYLYDDAENEYEYYDEAEDLSEQYDHLFDEEEEDLSEDVSSLVNEDDHDYDEYIVSMSNEDADGDSPSIYHNDHVILPGVTVN